MLSRRLITTSAVRCSNVVNARINKFEDEQLRNIEKSVARTPTKPDRTRVQWWRKPNYVAPHQHVFEQSPDFSFKDGRPIYVTSERQLEYKRDQIRLAKKIVALLKETSEVEKIHEQEESRRQAEQERLQARRPQAKGTVSIS